MEKKSENLIAAQIKKTLAAIFLAYIAFIFCFYFLSGDQLRYRESRGNIELAAAETGTIELVQNTIVEQVFSAKIQRLQSVSVQWGTYYRANAGTVTMELYDTRDNSLLMSQNFAAAEIPEGGLTTMETAEPIETAYDVPLLLRLYADALPGQAVSPFMSFAPREESLALYFNGAPADGVLCFAVSGEDYIWTGIHYWKLAAGFGLLLLAGIIIIWYHFRKGKQSYFVNALIAMNRYHFLIYQLVARDFKTKYKRSVLGVLWSFLNPLLIMCVQYFVFSTIFKNDIQNFTVYLLIGTVIFNFFSEACGMALSSILGNSGLIRKVYVPKYIYPLTRVISSVINLIISLIPLWIVCIITHVQFHKSVILSLWFFICLIVFCLGLGLLLSASMVFFRDTQFLWNVFSMIWMYATPVFYPETILPDQFKFVLQINPLYYFMKNVRLCILNGISPEPMAYVQCLLIATLMLLTGAVVFRKSQDRFLFYL